MTPLGEAHHNIVHCSYSPISLGAHTRRWAPVEGRDHDNFVLARNDNLDSFQTCGFGAHARTLWHGSDVAARIAQERSEACTPVQLTVSVCVAWGRASW